MAGKIVEFPSNGIVTQGYLATPQSGKGPGILVIQEWWGLAPHIKSVCDRLAAEGFTALAPDLYHGKSAKEPDEAGKLMMALNIEQAAGVLKEKGLFIVSGVVSLLLSVGYLEGDDYYQGEFYFLVLASVTGAVIMASARDLITIFVGLELVSAPAFLLAGWRKGDLRSNEASLKFFLTGVLSAAVMLFGMSLVYGLTRAITFPDIARGITSFDLQSEPVFVLAVVFVMVGFAFKIAAMPPSFFSVFPDSCGA